eukprot:1157904-Pelagomonas_calceolata.AAC.2
MTACHRVHATSSPKLLPTAALAARGLALVTHADHIFSCTPVPELGSLVSMLLSLSLGHLAATGVRTCTLPHVALCSADEGTEDCEQRPAWMWAGHPGTKTALALSRVEATIQDGVARIDVQQARLMPQAISV